jgi:hypothetical protein
MKITIKSEVTTESKCVSREPSQSIISMFHIGSNTINVIDENESGRMLRGRRFT